MNEHTKGSTMYERFSAVAELNKAPGFDPLRFARRVAQNGGEKLLLDLKYKKLWFRLRYPQGRIKVTPLKITEQLAIIEAKVFFDRGDTVPAASFIAQRYAKDTPGGLYIESAQHTAVDAALDDAGFGVQLMSADEQQPAQAGTTTKTAPVDLPIAPPKAVATATPPIASEPVAPVTQEQRLPSEIPVQTAPVQEPPTTSVEPAPTTEAATPQEPVSPATVETIVAPTEAPPMEQVAAPETAEQDPIAEVTATEQPPVEQVATVEDTPHTPPVLEIVPTAVETAVEDVPAVAAVGDGRYTADTPVDEICALMTLDEARNVIVDIGTCKGQTLAWVSERRAASLKWYLNGYEGDNNMLRAGAKLLLEHLAMNKAS